MRKIPAIHIHLAVVAAAFLMLRGKKADPSSCNEIVVMADYDPENNRWPESYSYKSDIVIEGFNIDDAPHV
jgi:purine nucleoside permease